ncbi:hypothetical protein ACI789_23770 [Geodermatophilus sp. SYSU D00965]
MIRRPTPPRSAAAPLALLVAVLPACAPPVAAPAAPLTGLHGCPGAGPVVGVFTGQAPSPSPADSPAVVGHDTWALHVDGSTRPLTDDGVHLGAVISPDGRSVYSLRSSGRVQADAPETPGVVERLDLLTGEVTEVARLPGTVDLGISGDGRSLAAAHTVEPHPDTGLDVNSVTVVDLTSLRADAPLPRAADVDPHLFSAVAEVALSPDGGRVAYALAVEVRPGTVVNTLRIRDRGSGADTVVHTAPGTDFVSDVDWSADGTTVLAAIRHQRPTDTAEDPARFQVLRVDVATGRTTLEEGFTPDVAPLTADGSRLLGIAAPDTEADPGASALIAWDRARQPSRVESLPAVGAGISVASCSYR